MTAAHDTNASRRLRDEYGSLTPLFAQMAALAESDVRRTELREHLICGHLALAEHIASRYCGKGIAKEDLLQVASVGLIHAVDRFDPALGYDFLGYAIPTIMGEVRRHFRDTTWPMRVPRRLQELRLEINRASAELAQELGRPVTDADLAADLGISEAEVAEGHEARQAYRTVSLDQAPGPEDDRVPLAELLGEEDRALELVENHEALVPLLQELPEREQRILVLRFYEHKTQSQIADEVGLSQMHVSRLLKSTLTELRERILTVSR
jgi:RNA polymerase sigma-B factor